MARRSLKLSSLSLRPRRPSIVRTSSTSSTKSQDCPSPSSTTSFTAAGASESVQQSIASGSSPGSLDTQRIGRSRPIAIELPPRRKTSQVETPPEPLSARGDRPGGYFPLHEDVQRSYKSHPFHHDNNSIKSTSLSGATMPESLSPHFTPLGHVITETPPLSESLPLPPASDPLTTSKPLGKYHPSNYKNKNETRDKQGSPALTTLTQPLHTRQKSDIRKKLQQYQRDMVEQAALAGRMQVPGSKPISPRLLPLRSPGPVTPMELEESGGYLSAGARSGSNAAHQQEMREMMIRAADERDKPTRKS